MSEGFLHRWSRLKAASAKSAASAGAKEAVASPGSSAAPAPAELTPADLPPPVLPPVDELTAESDFSPFLKEGVPAELRALALRKLWHSDPTLAAMDPLDLHNIDYRLPSVGELVTSAWQVGRGYLAVEGDSAAHPSSNLESPQVAPQFPVALTDTPDTSVDDAAPGANDVRGDQER